MSSRIFRDDLLAGKVAVVTGGGTGIGAATARELARVGATVVIASRKKDHVEPAAAGLSEQVGRTVYGDLCDIRDRDSVNGFVSRVVSQHGGIDILINNGGGQFFSPADSISPRGWDAVINTNLTGTWNVTRAAHDAWMGAHGGKVISITMLTQRGFPGMAHSVASRAGVEAMTRTLAVEWASKGIVLNAIAPGYIASNGIRNYPPDLGLIEKMQSCVPLKRMGSMDEVAWMITHLASPAGDYITGQTITIDGGKDLWGDYWIIPDPEDLKPFELPVEPWEHFDK